MSSLDGIIALPKGLKQEARRLVAIVFMLAPIGVLASLAFTQTDQSQAASRTTTSPSTPTVNQSASVVPPQFQTPLPQQSSSSIEFHASQTTPTQPPITKVQVNQQSITVPPNGNVHKVISNDGSTTTLDVTNSSNISSDTSSSSSTNIQLNTFSNTTTNSQTDTGP